MTVALNEYYVKRSGMKAFLDGIDGNPDSPALSAYISPGLDVVDIENMVSPGGAPVPGEIVREAAGSGTGAVIFSGSEKKCLVLPPFPVSEKVVYTGYATEPLRSLLEKDYTIGLVLVHLGNYAVGVCRGESLVSSKVGKGLVHARTRKGGSSSQRFQRRRENQAKEFLERVCSHAAEHLKPYEKTLDFVRYGGPRQTVFQLQKVCSFLSSLEARTLPVMDVPAVRQKVLEAAVSRVWSTKVIEWGEE